MAILRLLTYDTSFGRPLLGFINGSLPTCRLFEILYAVHVLVVMANDHLTDDAGLKWQKCRGLVDHVLSTEFCTKMITAVKDLTSA